MEPVQNRAGRAENSLKGNTYTLTIYWKGLLTLEKTRAGSKETEVITTGYQNQNKMKHKKNTTTTTNHQSNKTKPKNLDMWKQQ